MLARRSCVVTRMQLQKIIRSKIRRFVQRSKHCLPKKLCFSCFIVLQAMCLECFFFFGFRGLSRCKSRRTFTAHKRHTHDSKCAPSREHDHNTEKIQKQNTPQINNNKPPGRSWISRKRLNLVSSYSPHHQMRHQGWIPSQQYGSLVSTRKKRTWRAWACWDPLRKSKIERETGEASVMRTPFIATLKNQGGRTFHFLGFLFDFTATSSSISTSS